MSYFISIPDKYQKGNVKDNYGTIMWLFFLLGILHSIAIAFLFVEFPTLPSFFFSAFDVSNEMKYLFLPLEYIGVVLTWANGLLYIELAMVFCFTTIFWMKQIR